jgi:Ni/Co efflux regulator RcnB
MRSRSTKFLLPLAAVAAMAVPAVAQARHGSDDPPNHVRREHHRADRDDAARDRDRNDRRGGDDGPNHR